MPTKPTQLRIPPEVLERIDAAAARAGETRTAWIIRACEARLGPEPIADLIGELETLRVQKRENAKLPPVVPAPGTRFKCRVHGCEFAAGSSKAFCPNHPGPLLPV